MVLFRLVKWTRRLRILLGGYKSIEAEHYLFNLDLPLSALVVYERLIPYGYQYNVMSTTFRGQIFTVRRLSKLGYQYHIRFYRDGRVSGHYERDPDLFPREHLAGKDLRPLKLIEAGRLYDCLKEV